MSIKVVDAPMGFGKTSAMINLIVNAPKDKRFVFVTPYLDEVDRIKKACPRQNFKVPSNHEEDVLDGKPRSKMIDFKIFVEDRENIVTTHALFQKFDDEALRLIQDNHYILIMDEVMDVVKQHPITTHDAEVICTRFARANEEKKNVLEWNPEEASYTGKFEPEKRMCEQGMLWYYSENTIMQMLPRKMFSAFDDVYILTYLFKAQKQKYYFDIVGLEYEYLWVTGDSPETYAVTNQPVVYKMEWLKDKIHICQDRKLNEVGRRRGDFSKRWYNNPSKKNEFKQAEKNARNYFQTTLKATANDVLWTSFKNENTGRPQLGVRHYSTGFIPCNIRATNDYRTKDALAYLVNRFYSPIEMQFFSGYGIEVDQDTWALSEMIQWIWRSAIRDGKEIWVYIPSRRMRTLLETWIKEVSTGIVVDTTASPSGLVGGSETATVSPQQQSVAKKTEEKISA